MQLRCSHSDQYKFVSGLEVIFLQLVFSLIIINIITFRNEMKVIC